ncbi:DUF262 domain-containing HNH endonuclease family protein [Desulfococcaceae bacterium HSG9]|nr:DUF262 domain-containing HNH endonuclease family protein [Desulfococcaceae bacterium HSG9]
MEASTTIRKILAGNKIVVPPYQRAYSWDTPSENNVKNTNTDVFLSDLEEYYNSKVSNPKSKAGNPYYFGHFLFEAKNNEFAVIDGQQRLTTIIIFLSGLVNRLKTIRNLSVSERHCYEDMVIRDGEICFSTVEYDDELFIEYVIKQTKTDHNELDTESKRRIVRAFDYFTEQLSNKPEQYLADMLSIVSESACTTHLVKNASEAIQMFIFQNNRGKKPSNLEIVKAQFMYNVHLHGGEKKNDLIKKIKEQFEIIYKSISAIEYRINEDDILVYTLRVYFNSLWEANALDKINRELSKKDPIHFIEKFTQSLSASFTHLSNFFGDDERENISIHSLITLGGIAIACPFIIKAYIFSIEKSNEIGRLCASLENLVLRHRLIGTKAYMESRINDVFEKFTATQKEIDPIIERIDSLKTTTDWWWAYWNDEELEKSIQGKINPSVAKHLLWKYENHLTGQKTRFDKLFDSELPELEHIAPTTEPEEKPHGYGEYDEEFENQYLNCFGNYLLLSESHNRSIGNANFAEKLKTYTRLEQQRTIKKLVPENGVWDKKVIQERKEQIIQFVLDNC